MIADTTLQGRMRLAAAGLLCAVVAGTVSCGDGLAPDGGPDGGTPAALVSNPVAATALATTASAALLAPASVTYVSLVPGTYRAGVSATINNRGTGTGLRVSLVAGGVDPVPIAAEAGDTLAFTIDTGGVQPARFDQPVPLFMRPRVVRTSPAAGKRDVPLNVRVLVIFSEPIDPRSLTGATVGLEQAGTPVEGEVTVSADGLEATFQAAADLLPGTAYTIVVRNGIRDSNGSELGAPLTADFTTASPGTAPGGAIEVVVGVSGIDVDGEYAATLDGATPFPLIVVYPTLPDRPAYLPAVPAGDHIVSLVPPVNCSVKEGPRSVTLSAGDLIRVAFSVTCVPFLGTVRITAPTTGQIPNSTRYSVMHEHYGVWDYGADLTYLGALEPNDTLIVQTAMSKWGGIYWHDFAMRDVPAGCTVQGPNPTDRDTLTFGDTLDVEFPVTCSTPPSGVLAFTDAAGDIYITNADGSDRRRLTSEAAPFVLDANASWSPDGRRIAFSRSDGYWADEIYLINADGTNQVRLSAQGAYDAHPTWSPDGRRIAFEHRRDSVSGGQIYVMDADGTNRVRLTDDRQPDAFPAWSPDGDRIAYMGYSGSGNADIYVMSADGTNRVNLTNDITEDTDPAWSPDGSRIVFSKSVPGGPDLFIVNADGTNLVHLTTRGSAAQPSWSPDGQVIAFTRYPLCDDPNPISYDRQCLQPVKILMIRVTDGQVFELPQPGVSAFYPSWRP